jgi:hypothetical protein
MSDKEVQQMFFIATFKQPNHNCRPALFLAAKGNNESTNLKEKGIEL